ncbi:MAG TPA: histidinol-phosphate transaminase [Candidatus Saccharimonadales bacterium]|nr:histidinol-phosphate transaminase [Candidatus Saccharimonadales bacterium]
MPTIDLRYTVLNQPVPPFIYEALESYSTASNHYFHQPDALREAIAKHHDVPIDTVQLMAGTDQSILLLSAIYGQQTHIFTPTYISYVDAKRFGGELHEHWSLQDGLYQIPTETIPGASLIFLANPNNPAGMTSRRKVMELVRNNPDTTVVVDEAYGDFASESVIAEVASNPNLVVARSFSKGFALAGFRIAYLVAQPTHFKKLALETMWFNTAYTSVGAALTALQHQDHYIAVRAELVETRTALEKRLQTAGYSLIPSSINAVLIDFGDESDAQHFVEHLKADDICIQQGGGDSNVGLGQQYVRMSIGTKTEMEHVWEAIQTFPLAK